MINTIMIRSLINEKNLLFPIKRYSKKNASYDKIAYFQCCMGYMPWTHKKGSEHIIHNTMKSLNVLISRALEINVISVKYMKNIHIHIKTDYLHSPL